MGELEQRSRIAEILIAFSLAGLVIISVVVISLNASSAMTVFNSVLPLLGTWVGTVLAYYFSRANFATAVSAYKQVSAPSATLAETPVTSAMIDKGKIGGLVTIVAGQSEADVKLQADLLNKLSQVVTRIPVVDSTGAVKYILHENTLHKFVTKNTAAAAAPGAPAFDLATATLKTLLDDPEFKKLATTFAIISSSATLADAKQKMDETPNCQDVFVTQTAKPSEPMLGWITDATLASYANV
jgi:hypothetical protein